jgi:DNA-binding CsgD family transcriptional regulator
VARGDVGSDEWCTAQRWLGYMAAFSAGWGSRSLGHFTASRDAAEDRGPSRVLADALVGRSQSLSGMGQVIRAAKDARRSLAVAREAGYPAGKALALALLSRCAFDAGDLKGAVRLARRAEQIPSDICGWNARWTTYNLAFILDRAGDLAAAREACAAGLDRCREAGDLWTQAILLNLMPVLDLRVGRIEDAAAHLEEELQLTARIGARMGQLGSLDSCAQLCAMTGRPAEAVTLWAAHATLSRREEQTEVPAPARRRQQALHDARQALGPDRARAAEDRGAAMSLDTAAEYALMLIAPAPQQPRARAGLGNLSARERELVTMVAQGRTNAQIAAQLHVSARTVGSHLDRIRNMTGCRRRADLTRLGLQAGLV